MASETLTSKETHGLSLFERHLTPWVTLATAAMVFELSSGAALATVVGVLIEVPVMLMLVRFRLGTKARFPR